MKIAVLYNRESRKVINLFGLPNRERYGVKAINRIVDALTSGGHQVISLESDKDLIDKLEEFMPRVLTGERPGMAFNLSYGIQGQARYTHVPGILEMVGIPYVGSGPLAHSLSLDKVVAKMIFVQNGIPTPEFAVLQTPESALPELEFPLIVKPKNEAVSMGIRVVNNRAELKEASGAIFDTFNQPVLVERYIEGSEINVGLLGNNPVEAFSPAQLVFGDGGPNIYTLEDKKGSSGREIQVQCPANLDAAMSERAQEIAIQAFHALGCFDCARVDMRLDDAGNLYVLEVNSLPSLGEHGSYVAAAEAMGLDFAGLTNRLVEVAAARYFGTPKPPEFKGTTRDPKTSVFSFLTERRDRIERTVESWVAQSSRSNDAIGIRAAAERLDATFKDTGLRPVRDLTDSQDVWTWESNAGIDDGTLLIAHLDVPGDSNLGVHGFRRDPEWLYGEGVGSSRAPLTMLEYAVRALRNVRRLSKLKLGVLCYADEGRDCVESGAIIRQAASRARRVFVLHAANVEDKLVIGRRGRSLFQITAEAKPRRLGQKARTASLPQIVLQKVLAAEALSSRSDRTAVSVSDIQSKAYPQLLPHQLRVVIQASYPKRDVGERLSDQIEQVFKGSGVTWHCAMISDRPPMLDASDSIMLEQVREIAAEWDIPAEIESSLLPSVAGLVPADTPALCGVGPVAADLFTSQEAVSRMSLVQRTLLLSQYLLALSDGRYR